MERPGPSTTALRASAQDDKEETFQKRRLVSVAFERSIPILRIFDVTKARQFYLTYLGFAVDFEHRFHDKAPLFMGISRDGLPLFLSEHHGDGSPGAHVRIDVRGLDELRAELASRDYRYMNPSIQEQEWGTRELCVIDPFGNKLIFSEHAGQ
ncbi:MAG TPA: glyoxalase superfamily protein [Candidatus Babeliales bacterium]|nr:glyoxalase superfamily protein [Candidatus Babeliales bacterium]